VMLPAMADVPGWPSRAVRESVLARTIHDVFPEPPDTLQALRRLVGEDQFPRVFSDLTPSRDVGPPPEASGLAPEVEATVARSTVKVSGAACRRIQEGSGFAAGPDLIVTNAHVVAGQRQTSVRRPDGRTLDATVIVFDPDRDLALLRVAGLGQDPLPIGDAEVGATGAVFGHPGGQESLRISPAAVRQRVNALGRDLYDSHPTRRDVFVLAANLRPGDSGGALVNASGTVVGVAFAIAPDRPGTAYALTTAELRPVLGAAPSAGPADTGPCLRAA
jgi:S1-C subfamily serine protease